MKDFELVKTFLSWGQQLNNYGYKVSTIENGFYIHNSKGTIVAECQTVDGLRAFAQAVEYLDPNAGLDVK
jgi:hypothetical protein